MPLVAYLRPTTSEVHTGAFRRGLRELGYVEGQNITLEVRSAEGDNRRLPALAAELAALKPDVIVTNSEPAIRAAKAAGTIPIVTAVVGDAVALGSAQSLSHLGGNLTGQTILSTDVLGKRLQMLHEIVGDPGCVAVLGVAGVNYDNSSRELDAAAKVLGVPLLPITDADVNELATAFCRDDDAPLPGAGGHVRPTVCLRKSANHRTGGPTPHRRRLRQSADSRCRGLMSYGPDTVDMVRRSAKYVDKILNRESPADLPIEQPTRFQLAINLKTAAELGLSIPPSILARADETIE